MTFDLTNVGDEVHELIVIKSDMDTAALPPSAARGEVDEAAIGEYVGGWEDVQLGAMASGTLTLAPGRYILLCNLTDHYARGWSRPSRSTDTPSLPQGRAGPGARAPVVRRTRWPYTRQDGDLADHPRVDAAVVRVVAGLERGRVERPPGGHQRLAGRRSNLAPATRLFSVASRRARCS